MRRLAAHTALLLALVVGGCAWIAGVAPESDRPVQRLPVVAEMR